MQHAAVPALTLALFSPSSVRLGESIKQFSRAMLDRLKYFFRDLKNKLQEKGRATEPVNAIQRQQREAAQAWVRLVGGCTACALQSLPVLYWVDGSDLASDGEQLEHL